MKKILAAMIIAVVAVAGVFAATISTDSPTSLELNYEIIERFEPAFTFKFGDISGDTFEMGNNGTGDNNTNKGFVSTDNIVFKIVDKTYANINAANDNTETASGDDNKKASRTLKVTLDTSASKWVLQQNDFTYESSAISIKTFSPVTDGNHTYVNSVGNRYAVASAATTDVENSITVSYTRGLIDRTDGVVVASFDIGWDADPKAPAGDYSATIAVTVEVV